MSYSTTVHWLIKYGESKDYAYQNIKNAYIKGDDLSYSRVTLEFKSHINGNTEAVISLIRALEGCSKVVYQKNTVVVVVQGVYLEVLQDIDFLLLSID